MLRLTIRPLKGIILKKDFEVMLRAFNKGYLSKKLYDKEVVYLLIKDLLQLQNGINNIEKSYLKKMYSIKIEMNGKTYEYYIGIPY